MLPAERLPAPTPKVETRHPGDPKPNFLEKIPPVIKALLL